MKRLLTFPSALAITGAANYLNVSKVGGVYAAHNRLLAAVQAKAGGGGDGDTLLYSDCKNLKAITDSMTLLGSIYAIAGLGLACPVCLGIAAGFGLGVGLIAMVSPC